MSYLLRLWGAIANPLVDLQSRNSFKKRFFSFFFFFLLFCSLEVFVFLLIRCSVFKVEVIFAVKLSFWLEMALKKNKQKNDGGSDIGSETNVRKIGIWLGKEMFLEWEINIKRLGCFFEDWFHYVYDMGILCECNCSINNKTNKKKR